MARLNMSEISKQYNTIKKAVLERLNYPITTNTLMNMLGDINDIVHQYKSSVTPEDQNKIIAEAKEYLRPKDIPQLELTTEFVLKALAINILVDEYSMSLMNMPDLNKKLWNELEKDGLTYNIWSDISKALVA